VHSTVDEHVVRQMWFVVSHCTSSGQSAEVLQPQAPPANAPTHADPRL
jgi:hypothetical protein